MQTIMPTARDTRRGAPLFPGPPTDASRETWPRWLGVNLWLFACVLVAVGAALVAISAVAGANDGDDAGGVGQAACQRRHFAMKASASS
jgi:hypothetical protein